MTSADRPAPLPLTPLELDDLPSGEMGSGTFSVDLDLTKPYRVTEWADDEPPKLFVRNTSGADQEDWLPAFEKGLEACAGGRKPRIRWGDDGVLVLSPTYLFAAIAVLVEMDTHPVTVRTVFMDVHRCQSNCQQAVGSDCVCTCGSVNHGIGSRSWRSRSVAQYRLDPSRARMTTWVAEAM